MGLFHHDREKERYYLLPGMGGKASRRKRNGMLLWGLLAGILVGAILAGVLFLINYR